MWARPVAWASATPVELARRARTASGRVTVIGLPGSTTARLAEAVLLLRLGHRQPADAGVRAPAIGDHDNDEDLIGLRRIHKTHLHGVEVGAHERGVLVMQRHVDGRARPAELLGRGNDGFAPADGGPERRPERGMKERRGMLILAVLPDHGRLAVGVHGGPQGGGSASPEKIPELLARLDQLLQILHEAPRERILDHRHRGDLPNGPRRRLPPVLENVLRHRHELANFHQCPPADGPWPFTTSAARIAGGVFRLRPILICPSMRIIEMPQRSPAFRAASAVLPTDPVGASTMQRSASRPGAITPTGRW